ncbi:hypothetical protein Tcan_03339 [Toxocara canis]|uniref:Activin_recp domain-containing protein n=1 Tax=Toxocara canis TaxID=6265 RepID=A0A0B2UWC5_TOXCA|nr:hypothetical protein Tcan_03339 [Toxocara canis]
MHILPTNKLNNFFKHSSFLRRIYAIFKEEMLTEHCVILSILVVAATAFECYTGRVITGYSGTNGYYDDSDCPKGTQFCLKLITPNKDGGEIIEKSCDINGACLNIGNHCNMDPDSKIETCCCNGDKCNSATSLVASILSMALLILLAI